VYNAIEVIKMKKRKSSLLKLTKETSDQHKKRASSGVCFRATVFEDRKGRLRDKAFKSDIMKEYFA
jgi:hypothetical protein